MNNYHLLKMQNTRERKQIGYQASGTVAKNRTDELEGRERYDFTVTTNQCFVILDDTTVYICFISKLKHSQLATKQLFGIPK